MAGLFRHGRLRAAVGLIAAYAIALQTLFAAFAPLPANAQAADRAGWHVLCFGSGNAALPDDGDPAAPPSGKFHCVLCGSMMASAAILPEAMAGFISPARIFAALFVPAPDLIPAHHSVRTGSARAPPLTA